MRASTALISAIVGAWSGVAAADPDPWGDDVPVDGTVRYKIFIDPDPDPLSDPADTARSSDVAPDEPLLPCCRSVDHGRVELEASVGGEGGAFHVGPVAGSTFAMHVTAGARYHKWAVLADYALHRFVEAASERGDPRHAAIHRVGGVVRYSFITGWESSEGLRGDLWAEVGAARELVRWDAGGRLDRTDTSVGFGTQGTFHWGPGKHRKIGLQLAMRLVIAPRPATKPAPPACEGPCDAPTGPSAWDTMYLFEVAVPFGW